MFFALDTTDVDFAVTLALIPDPMSLGALTDNTDIVVYGSTITPAEVEADGALADLQTANYPNALCRHRWLSSASFAISGWQNLGFSEDSFSGVAGRPAVFIRPQQGQSRTADNYGDGTGLTHYDALNGPQDPAIDGGATTNFQTGTDYFFCGGGPHGDAMTRWGDLGAGGNPGASNGLAGQGYLPVEDATGSAADKINILSDPDMPGLVWGGFTLPHSQLPWEEYDPTNHIYVNGGFQEPGTGSNVSGTGCIYEADVEDITQDMETLLKRHVLQGKSALSDLNGDTGRGRYYVQTSFGAPDVAWDRVLYNDGAGNWTDLTTAANDATTDDWVVMPAGAADNAYVAFVSATPFSTIRLNLSQVRVGGTVVSKYSQGSAAFGSFTNVVDPSSGLSANTFLQEIWFNPKLDWATDTFASGESFEVTGYAVIFQKTTGTITQAARGDQTFLRRRACFMHRWNDTTPVRGLCYYFIQAGALGNPPGYRFGLNGKGNVEFIRYRACAGGNQHSDWATATDLIFTGSQFGLIGSMGASSGTMAWTFRAATFGTRWWSIADHLHQDETDAFIVDLLTDIQRAIDDGVNLVDDGWEPDITAFDDMGDWSDILLPGTGPYASGSADWTLTIDGLKIRRPGQKFDGMNDADMIDVTTNDKHALAVYGNRDHASATYRRIGIERGTLMVDFYAQATGNNDAPVSGASSAHKNALFQHGYCSTFGGQVDGSQPTAGIVFENDPDIGRYDDGSGGNENNFIAGWGFKDIREGSGTTGTALACVADGVLKARYCLIDNPATGWATHGGFSNNGPRSTNAIRATVVPTFTDFTTNVMDTGNTASLLFPTGVADECLYLGVVRYVQRRFAFDLTVAGVGSPTLAWEFHNGTSWTAVSNLSDGTSGFTVDGTVTFDRPAATAQTVDSKTIYAIRVRIVSGLFTTVPQAVEISTETPAGSIDIQECRFKNVDVAAGCYVGRLTHGAGTHLTNASHVIDKNNVIELGVGQDANTTFYTVNGVGLYDLGDWQAQSKPALTTDAEVDSEYGVGNTLV